MTGTVVAAGATVVLTTVEREVVVVPGPKSTFGSGSAGGLVVGVITTVVGG